MPAPKVTRLGDDWWVQLERESGTTRSANALMFKFASLHDSRREGMTAEVIASDPDDPEMVAYYGARVTLSSAVSRSTFLKGLMSAGIELPRPGAFDRACMAVVEQERKGLPAEPLVAEVPSAQQWIVPGWIPRDEVSIVYGDGGMLKSFFCLALAVAALAGKGLGDLENGQPGPWVAAAPLTSVLYLDWEGNRRTHAGRLWGIAKPMNVNVDGRIIYRKVERPLADVVTAIRSDVAQHKCGLAIYDSIGLACGPEPETADAALRTFGVMRSIPTSHVAVGHIPHSQRDLPPGMDPRPFGSVHMNNQPRVAIWCSTPGDEQRDLKTVTYKQTKNNLGPKEPPTALRWAFDEEQHVVVTRHAPDPSKMSLSAQFIVELRKGKQETPTLAKIANVSERVAGATLLRMKNSNMIVQLNPNAGGRGNKSLWGLADTNPNRGEP